MRQRIRWRLTTVNVRPCQREGLSCRLEPAVRGSSLKTGLRASVRVCSAALGLSGRARTCGWVGSSLKAGLRACGVARKGDGELCGGWMVSPRMNRTRREPLPRRRRFAFTLIELLVVIAIIAILAGFCCRPWPTPRSRAKDPLLQQLPAIAPLGRAMYVGDQRGLLPCGSMNAPGGMRRVISPGTNRSSPMAASPTCCSARAIKYGRRHYWPNANIENGQQSEGNPKQTGVMALGFSVRPESLARPSDTVALTEIRDQNATYAFGGVSNPGEGWGSMLLRTRICSSFSTGI